MSEQPTNSAPAGFTERLVAHGWRIGTDYPAAGRMGVQTPQKASFGLMSWAEIGRLCDLLDRYAALQSRAISAGPSDPWARMQYDDMKAERDRLREQIQDNRIAWRIEADALRALNAELVEALKELERYGRGNSTVPGEGVAQMVREALERAKAT